MSKIRRTMPNAPLNRVGLYPLPWRAAQSLQSFCEILAISLEYNSGQVFFRAIRTSPLVELGAWLVVGVVLDLLPEKLNDNLALDRLAFVDGQPPVILQEIGQLDLGHAQHMRFEGAANQLAIDPDSAKICSAGSVSDEIGIRSFEPVGVGVGFPLNA